jgi:hypothetical protein
MYPSDKSWTHVSDAKTEGVLTIVRIQVTVCFCTESTIFYLLLFRIMLTFGKDASSDAVGDARHHPHRINLQ